MNCPKKGPFLHFPLCHLPLADKIICYKRHTNYWQNVGKGSKLMTGVLDLNR